MIKLFKKKVYKKLLTGLLASVSIVGSQLVLADYSAHPDALLLVQELVKEEGLDAEHLTAVLSQAEKRQSILDAISRPAERTFTWGRYRNIFLQDARIDEGAEFWRANQAVLEEAESEYGVPAEVIVAIIGVETLYGGNTGSYPVIDALSTLAFDYPRRAPFFRSELKHFLILTAAQSQDPIAFKGSYAGAMGLGQFMPSSYRAYAKSYLDDGFIDIWHDRSDAIWSVGNYLKAHGWKRAEPITFRVSSSFEPENIEPSSELEPDRTAKELVDVGISVDASISMDQPATLMALEIDDNIEHWVGWQNFYVITRYNHSKLYAMAVYQLAESIRERFNENSVLNSSLSP